MTETETLKNLEISAGNVLDVTFTNVIGHNEDIDIATAPQDVWLGGGNYTGHATQTETVDVFSSDAADTSAGTGARTIRIEGLQSTTAETFTTEDITMNGTTPVVSSNSWYRITKVFVLTAGSGAENAGIITVRHTTTTANIFSEMEIGLNESQMAVFTIPFNREGFITSIDLSLVRASGAAGSAEITVRVRDSGGVYRARYITDVSTSSSVVKNFTGYITCPALSDIKVTVDTVSDNNSIVGAVLGIIVIKST